MLRLGVDTWVNEVGAACRVEVATGTGGAPGGDGSIAVLVGAGEPLTGTGGSAPIPPGPPAWALASAPVEAIGAPDAAGEDAVPPSDAALLAEISPVPDPDEQPATASSASTEPTHIDTAGHVGRRSP
jgi:hypothetical protein